jgi:hypothetical protein
MWRWSTTAYGTVSSGELVALLYVTGFGLLDSSAGDAMVAPRIERPLAPVTVKVGGQDVEVLYAVVGALGRDQPYLYSPRYRSERPVICRAWKQKRQTPCHPS